ncbi:MAG: TIGR04282 family arsenosugar biosynthesis glycosyltransferase [Vulcanimicrobiaceae bacterium]
MLAKAPIPGSVKTRLVPPLSADEAAALARAFAADTAARLESLAPALGAVPFVYHTPDDAPGELRLLAGTMVLRPQGTGDLGRRMSAIVAALCAEGFAHVVLVGADIPTLPDACVAAAFEALAAGVRVAIARADDGGYVLLGVDAPHAVLFDGVAWSTSAVYDTTMMRARAAGLAVRELAGWYDVDTAGDLERLRRDCSGPAGDRAPRTRRLLKSLTF